LRQPVATGLAMDKFNAQLWQKQVQARFRDEYTERREVAHEGGLTVNVIDSYGSNPE
jgi:hypothetical protein